MKNKQLSERQIKELIQSIKWMCYDVYITIENQIYSLNFYPRFETLVGGSYCFYVNGQYRTRKWIRENCITFKNDFEL